MESPLKSEPVVLINSAVTAVLMALIAVDVLPWTVEQAGLVAAAIVAVTVLIRSFVSPAS